VIHQLSGREGNVVAELPDTLKAFICKEISSVHELETLIFLRDHPERSWSPTEVAAHLFASLHIAEKDLESLKDRGFISCDGTDELPYYQYISRSEVDSSINDLATAYREFRVKVIGQIFFVENNRSAKRHN
jgi:hypothetical protein